MQEAFAAELSRRSGARYYGSTISLMENGRRAVSIREAELIAAMDPLKRSPSWVAFGERATELEEVQGLTPPERARALAQAKREEHERRGRRKRSS